MFFFHHKKRPKIGFDKKINFILNAEAENSKYLLLNIPLKKVKSTIKKNNLPYILMFFEYKYEEKIFPYIK